MTWGGCSADCGCWWCWAFAISLSIAWGGRYRGVSMVISYRVPGIEFLCTWVNLKRSCACACASCTCWVNRRGGTPMSAQRATGWPYTCSVLFNDELRVTCRLSTWFSVRYRMNRELFKGRRSLEPVGSRTDTVERGNVGDLVG